ncbi:hypothetical protein RZS08_37780, partial [Arthrospira platensis SPKY1]|nr:hypothetical protein [Arthrospira platensis SPKY1]
TDPVADPLGDIFSRYARTHGPFTTAEAAAAFGVGIAVAHGTLNDLAQRGRLVAGEFRPGGAGAEWVDPDVLRRVRRRSVAALREQSEPVPPQVLGRFLPHWHGLHSPRRGVDAVFAVLD